jgi:digeranylgeranylglycerophospholipid reductase
MKNKWDVIVVGGGPGGLFAAWEIAKAGKSVLLCERKREMGVPVRCAEAVGYDDIISILPVEERWVSANINTFIMVLPDGQEVKLKNDLYTGYIFNRDLFEYDVAAKASNDGAKIVMKSNVIDLIKDDDGTIKGVKVLEMGAEKDYFASYVIAADGVESRIARKAGIDTHLKPEDIEPCAQATVSNANLKENAIYMYIGKCYAPGGYAWVFPKANNCANVGLGINGKYASTDKHAIDYLNEFIEKFFPHASVQKLISGGVPVTTTLDTLSRDNLMIVGDAGHMVNPLNGGGITLAIYSGIIAAKSIIAAIDAPEKREKLFKKYEKDISKKFGKSHESQYRIKDVVYQLSDDEFCRIAKEVNKLPEEKRNFFRVFTQVVKHKPEVLIDVTRAFAGI